MVRQSLFTQSDPLYTGITCLMGVSETPRQRGITLLSSSTTKCHACYYPVGPQEQIFQIYYEADERPEEWKPLGVEDGKRECEALANTLS